jgi:hypothetical protein
LVHVLARVIVRRSVSLWRSTSLGDAEGLWADIDELRSRQQQQKARFFNGSFFPGALSLVRRAFKMIPKASCSILPHGRKPKPR